MNLKEQLKNIQTQYTEALEANFAEYQRDTKELESKYKIELYTLYIEAYSKRFMIIDRWDKWNQTPLTAWFEEVGKEQINKKEWL